MKNIFVCFKNLQTGPESLLPILRDFGFKEFKNVLDENQFYDLRKDKFNAQSSAPEPDATQSSKKEVDSTQTAGMMQNFDNEYWQKLFRVWKIVLKDGVDEETVLKRLQSLDFVEFAHFANKYKLHSNDPRYNNQWYIPNVKANLAWDITQGNGSLIVAVIDSGVDYSHNDIMNNMWRNPVTGNFGFNTTVVIDDENPMDLSGHGTHVAGVIGAITNNSLDTAGIAQVKIMAIKAFGGADDEDDNMVAALYKAAVNGAKIVNNSWGPESRSGVHTTLETALLALAALNIICVFSAGDDRLNINTVFPGTSENEIIIVAGSDDRDVKTRRSNFGTKVTILAPGEKIHSLFINSRSPRMDGTSAAAPIVSGAIALLLSQSPNLTLVEIKNRLRQSSDNKGQTNFNPQTGRLNIHQLLLNNNPSLMTETREISAKVLPHPLNERNMNPDEKKFLLFQFALVNHLKAKLEKQLQDLGVGDILSLTERIMSDESPEVELIQQIEMTEKLLWIYRDVAKMYSVIDSPDNCPTGYYVCTLNGVTTCCAIPEIMLIADEPENEEVLPVNISDLLKNNVFLYWNCEISIYHTINPNLESKKVLVEEIFLRPKSGIKILDLNDIDDININNIKTVHFGAPYNIFIDL